MAIVNEIREIRGLTAISLDGSEWIRLTKKHFAKNPLEAGEYIDPEAYIQSMAAIQAADCYEAALTVLDQTSKTEGEMRKKLIMKGYVAPAVEAAIQRLRDNRLLDDRRIAERIAQTQIGKPVGIYALKRKLQAKQLSREDIEAAMEGFDDEQQANACKAAAEKLWKKYAELPKREARAKLSQGLGRRGFSWDAISGAVDAIISEWDEF